MSRKGFLVKVELDIQKITCPGVWLCSNGKVSLQIHMLDSSIQTSCCKPVFPIYCHEKFVFYKNFYNAHRLNELQRSLNNEWVYAELVQWQSCDEGCVLATFQTTLDDLLYPSSLRGVIGGLDIDLLMETTELFPGTIAPKLEVSTKTTVEETLCDLESEMTSKVVVNPKLLLSAQSPPRKCRPRKVCHSVGFSRAHKKHSKIQGKSKPIFQYRKVNDDLILRSNPNIVLRNGNLFGKEPSPAKPPCQCYCYLRSRSVETLPSQTNVVYRRASPERIPNVTCSEKVHKDIYCPVCSKYEGIFASNVPRMDNFVRGYARTDTNRPPKLCSYCRQMANAKYHIKSSTGSLCESDTSEGSKKKVCFCLPAEKTSSLAQQLHDKLSRTLDSNSRFLRNCIDCEDYTCA